MYAPAREVAEGTWVEEAVVYIDALPVFLKIVVVFGEKVGDFQPFAVIMQRYNLFRYFLMFRTALLKCRMSPRNFYKGSYPCRKKGLFLKVRLVYNTSVCHFYEEKVAHANLWVEVQRTS